MVQMDNNGLRTNIEETLQVLKALQLNKFEFPGQMLKIREDQVKKAWALNDPMIFLRYRSQIMQEDLYSK